MRILVVEDDDSMRLTLVRLLEREGHTVVWASSGEDAIRMMQDEPLDCVVLDMILNGASGWDVLRVKFQDVALRALPVIILSGLTSQEIHDGAHVNILSGAVLIMGKPFDVGELLDAISRVCATGEKG